MIIECPACKTRAKLPDSKEGAKVRCTQCGRVYVAGAPGRAGRSSDPTKYFLIGGAVLLAAVMMYFVNKSAGNVVPTPPPQVKEEKEPVVYTDSTGWNSELVTLARDLHEFANLGNTAKLRAALHPELVYERLHGIGEGGELAAGDAAPEDGGAESETEVGAEETEAEPGAEEAAPQEAGEEVLSWVALPADEKSVFLTGVVDELIAQGDDNLVASWEPFDVAGVGDLKGVVELTDERAVVRLAIAHRSEPTVPDKHIEWHFAKDRGKWKAWSWERWISPDERARQRRSSTKLTKRTLSDGSFVVEGEIRPIPHLESTSPEDRERIDELVEQLIDLSITGSRLTAIKDEIATYEKAAIPALLTKLAEIPLDDEETAIKLGLLHYKLYDITGYETTFKPSVALGATEERMRSGLKQWFGWYDSKFKRFQGKEEGEIALDDLAEEEQQLIEEERQRKAAERKYGTENDR